VVALSSFVKSGLSASLVLLRYVESILVNTPETVSGALKCEGGNVGEDAGFCWVTYDERNFDTKRLATAKHAIVRLGIP
jgi:hypothetical protein